MQPIAGENDILVGELMAAGHDTVIDVGPGLLEHGLKARGIGKRQPPQGLLGRARLTNCL